MHRPGRYPLAGGVLTAHRRRRARPVALRGAGGGPPVLARAGLPQSVGGRLRGRRAKTVRPGRGRGHRLRHGRCVRLTARGAAAREQGEGQAAADERDGGSDGGPALVLLPARQLTPTGRPAAVPRRLPGGVLGAGGSHGARYLGQFGRRVLVPVRGVARRCGVSGCGGHESGAQARGAHRRGGCPRRAAPVGAVEEPRTRMLLGVPTAPTGRPGRHRCLLRGVTRWRDVWGVCAAPGADQRSVEGPTARRAVIHLHSFCADCAARTPATCGTSARGGQAASNANGNSGRVCAFYVTLS
jgi:hypothetical protein